MSPSTHQPQLKMTAMMAATVAFGTAVASAEPSAAFVSFQRQALGFPPNQNDNSAASR